MISSLFLIYLVCHIFLTRKDSNNKRKYKLFPKNSGLLNCGQPAVLLLGSEDGDITSPSWLP